ncbi:alpha-N-acetylgalactosaminide alpha-2,6-sialyltransferase 6 isoform X3 [Ictalurus punctatus]|nr:alpha-N-acetylgalactosaminide alpha-2,6-sialyltransferase 6 isoform X3 [Ictalurus punctatus]XP_017348642.1 alpha-N-acetylgalactosaminide alpha-2,6-sialyltransferase 6 isoform X3 [Ictalurus punctatus]XP_047017665.1 alpha-N-acetylgalactosaminide alpha-2,6-sialyltransferase 6 isoform X3 [Ictalurus punctatus]
MGLRLAEKGHHSKRMVVFVALFLITTLFFLYNSNSTNESYETFKLAAYNSATKNTDLKKWAGKDGYIPVFGNKSLTLHCGQCAMVTSSSHLLGTGAGAEIDRAECVIRMNDAPTSGFEADVGNKTTLRVVAHSSVIRFFRKPQEFLNCSDCPSVIFWGPPTKIGPSANGALYKLIHRVAATCTNLTTFVVTPSKMRKFDTLFHKETGRDRQKSQSWLSTGWFTMVIAIEICDKIKVYGMVPPSYCGRHPQPKRMPYHYYKPRGPDECVTYLQNERGRRGNHHRFITEKQVFARWAKLYNISFVHPTW